VVQPGAANGNKPDVKKADQPGSKPAVDRGKDLAEQMKRRTKLLEPLNLIFERQLKPRLDKLPTTAQRQGADATDAFKKKGPGAPASAPGAGGGPGSRAGRAGNTYQPPRAQPARPQPPGMPPPPPVPSGDENMPQPDGNGPAVSPTPDAPESAGR
jgi:hypothetical protein